MILACLFWAGTAVAATSTTPPVQESLSSTGPSAFDGNTERNWPDPVGTDQPSGRIEMTIVAPEPQVSTALIDRGTDFSVWVWQGQVHARFGDSAILRPAENLRTVINEGEQHTITLSWDADAGDVALYTNGRLTIRHPSKDFTVRDGAIALGRDPAGNQLSYVGEASFAAYADPVRPPAEDCALGTLSNQPIPGPECNIGDEVTVAWQRPTANEDGSPLDNLAEYRIYWGPESRSYIGSITVPESQTTHTFQMPPGDHFMAMTSVNADGDEGRFSNEVTRSVEAPDSPPLPPVILEQDTTAFTVIKQRDRFVLLPIGTAPAGTECDPSQTVNGHMAVPTAEIEWAAGSTARPVVVVAQCNG